MRFGVFSLIVVAMCLPLHAANDELPSTYAGEGLASILSASGTIVEIAPQRSRILIKCSKPYWSPIVRGSAKVVLWPTDILFDLKVTGPTPITINGKHGGFSDLAPGQQVSVEYILIKEGYVLFPYAHRIVATSGATSRGPPPEAARKPKK